MTTKSVWVVCYQFGGKPVAFFFDKEDAYTYTREFGGYVSATALPIAF